MNHGYTMFNDISSPFITMIMAQGLFTSHVRLRQDSESRCHLATENEGNLWKSENLELVTKSQLRALGTDLGELETGTVFNMNFQLGTSPCFIGDQW